MESTDLIAAFNAWHWVEPDKGVDLASQLLSSGGSLALVWTKVLSWVAQFRKPIVDRAPWRIVTMTERRVFVER